MSQQPVVTFLPPAQPDVARNGISRAPGDEVSGMHLIPMRQTPLRDGDLLSRVEELEFSGHKVYQRETMSGRASRTSTMPASRIAHVIMIAVLTLSKAEIARTKRQQSGPHSPLCGAPPHPTTPHKCQQSGPHSPLCGAPPHPTTPRRCQQSGPHSPLCGAPPPPTAPRKCQQSGPHSPLCGAPPPPTTPRKCQQSGPHSPLCGAPPHPTTPRKCQQSGPHSPLCGAPPHPTTPRKTAPLHHTIHSLVKHHPSF